MTNLVPDVFYKALEDFIEGLEPAGGLEQGAGVEARYKVAADEDYKDGFELSTESDIDRQFMIPGVVPDSVELVCGISANLFTGSFELDIGHMVGDYRASRDRRDKDTQQLIAQLMREDNFADVDGIATGAFKIRFESYSRTMIKDGRYWQTTITFSFTYHTDSNYGG
jgi:hypothetical protein